MPEEPQLRWTEGGEPRSARWRSERGAPPPSKVRVVDDRITADDAYGAAAQGMSMKYHLEERSGKWVVTGRQDTGSSPHGAGAMPPAAPGDNPHGAAPADNPHGAAPASGKMPSPEDLPPAKKQ